MKTPLYGKLARHEISLLRRFVAIDPGPDTMPDKTSSTPLYTHAGMSLALGLAGCRSEGPVHRERAAAPTIYQIGVSCFVQSSHFRLQKTERILPVFVAVPAPDAVPPS